MRGRQLLSSQQQFLNFLFNSNLLRIHCPAANRILVSRHTRTPFYRVFSSDPVKNLVAVLRAGGFKPNATGQEFDGIEAMEAVSHDQKIAVDNPSANDDAILRPNYGLKTLIGEQKKLYKQQQHEERKAEIVAAGKERRRSEGERKRKAWDEKLACVPEEVRLKLIEERRGLRMKTVSNMNAEKAQKIERLEKAREHGQNIVIDLEFAHLMSPMEIKSLIRQIMFCYAANGRSSSPGHLWLTGCRGNMETHLLKIPGYENWIIEKETWSYIEAFGDRKHDLVYLTPDSETILDDLDPKKLYVLGGLVDRTRQKGITWQKAIKQGIQTARLPIRQFLKESSCQILAINQVVELLLKFKETRDWKASFVHAVPQRKRPQT